MSSSRLGEEVVIVHSPGPCSGMTATGEAGLTSPSTSLFATPTLDVSSFVLAVKSVVMADDLFGAGATACTGAVGLDVVVG
jgi:hypothetical protein